MHALLRKGLSVPFSPTLVIEDAAQFRLPLMTAFGHLGPHTVIFFLIVPNFAAQDSQRIDSKDIAGLALHRL